MGITSILLIFIGSIGNPLTFYILTRPKFLKETIFRYFIVAEIIDMINLILLLIWFLSSAFKFIEGVLACKLLQYIAYVLFSLYPWISTLNSVDRLLAINFRSQFKFRKELKFQALAVGCIVFAALLANIPYLIYIDLDNNSNCVLQDDLVAFYIYLGYIIGSDVIPFFIRILCTVFTVMFLIRSKRKVYRLKPSYKRETTLLKSVLTMDIWFLICYTPVIVIDLIQHKYSIRSATEPFWLLLHDTLAMLPMVQASCNFFIFLLCNKLFKKQFYSLMKCCKKPVASNNYVANYKKKNK